MLNIIDAEKKYLEQYKEAYIETERQIKLGIINKRNQLFLNPDKTDVIDEYKTIEIKKNYHHIMYHHMISLLWKKTI